MLDCIFYMFIFYCSLNTTGMSHLEKVFCLLLMCNKSSNATVRFFSHVQISTHIKLSRNNTFAISSSRFCQNARFAVVNWRQREWRTNERCVYNANFRVWVLAITLFSITWAVTRMKLLHSSKHSCNRLVVLNKSLFITLQNNNVNI